MSFTVYFGATHFKSAIPVKTITNMQENKEKKSLFLYDGISTPPPPKQSFLPNKAILFTYYNIDLFIRHYTTVLIVL